MPPHHLAGAISKLVEFMKGFGGENLAILAEAQKIRQLG
jgi:hypothetical protein